MGSGSKLNLLSFLSDIELLTQSLRIMAQRYPVNLAGGGFLDKFFLLLTYLMSLGQNYVPVV